ncbi:hypothetical protein [Vibrio parahaemolyticus]|uniref:hypothetical protein n=1 Tax=Vibrio parahaemolyticus TaxID=670 RepID=UPI0024AF8F8C|nr:hypothetical protein [Vibrio parahaemolyticus]MDI7854639.1 hypothetical protein [Vibrio parahaemolyticus]
MEHIKIIIKFFRYDLKNTITILIYSLFLLSLFVFAPRAHAAIDPTTPILSYRHVNGDYFLNADMVFQKYTNEEFCGADFFSDPNYFYNTRLCDRTTGEETRTWINANSSYFYSGYHTAQQCIDAGYLLLQVPTGFTHEGSYICSPLKGFGFGLNGSTNPDNPDSSITGEEFDAFYCSHKFNNVMSFGYYTNEEISDHYVEISGYGKEWNITDAKVLPYKIYCGDDRHICSDEEMVEMANQVAPVPESRINLIKDEFGENWGFSVFAYCENKLLQKSTVDLTADTNVDCRKGIFQITGNSGVQLAERPYSECYVDPNYDYSFAEWCSRQFDESNYWAEGTFEEYCDPPEKATSEEKVETSETCQVTTETIDVGYTTNESRDDITKTIKKKVITKDCEGNILDETIIDGSIIVDKSEILGDGSGSGSDGSDGSERDCVVGPYCPPKTGTSEGTGSGKGESEAGSSTDDNWGSVSDPDLEGWYESKYPDGFSGVINKNLELYNTGAFSDFLNSLNPFQDTGSFPILELDFDFGEVANFGRHSIDLESIPVSPTKTINLIALLKALLLIYASFYAFRQVL